MPPPADATRSPIFQELRFRSQTSCVQIPPFGPGLGPWVSVWEELWGNHQPPGLDPSRPHPVSPLESCGQPLATRGSSHGGEHPMPPPRPAAGLPPRIRESQPDSCVHPCEQWGQPASHRGRHAARATDMGPWEGGTFGLHKARDDPRCGLPRRQSW